VELTLFFVDTCLLVLKPHNRTLAFCLLETRIKGSAQQLSELAPPLLRRRYPESDSWIEQCLKTVTQALL